MANLTSLRMPKETEAAYAAFRCYAELGPARTLNAVAEILGRNRDNIGKYSAKWKWVERARLYDNRIQRELDAKALAVRQKWETRRLKEQERNYERSQILDQKAQDLANLPVTRRVVTETYEDGREKTVVFEAAGWRVRDIGALWMMASEMAKHAIDEAMPPQLVDDKKQAQTKFSDARAEAMLEAAGRIDEDDDPPND